MAKGGILEDGGGDGRSRGEDKKRSLADVDL
jgi:hypothetical protein